ncbi:hypothetical protein LTR27_006692 [Elasticomyces elasticus]|nr:hypothetical protein LTR27_006692 [Elasticomyces elasticus]
MARFATAASPYNLQRGSNIESLHAMTESMASIAKTMFIFNATAVKEKISVIKDCLEDVAPFICEGKVSPFTADCEKAAVQHGYRLRKTVEAFKIQIESDRELREANGESPMGDKFGKVAFDFGKVSLERQQEVAARQLEAGEVATNLVAEMHANASELKACPFDDIEDARERCSKARPLTKDEFRKLDVPAMQQMSHQAAHAMQYHKQRLSATKGAGKFECAQAMESTLDKRTLLDKFTKEYIESEQEFILIFEDALATPGKNLSSLVASWDNQRSHMDQSGSKLHGEFTAAFVKQQEICEGYSLIVQEADESRNVVQDQTRGHEELYG